MSVVRAIRVARPMVKRWRLQPYKEVEQRAALREALIILSALLRVVMKCATASLRAVQATPLNNRMRVMALIVLLGSLMFERNPSGCQGLGSVKRRNRRPTRSHPEGLL